MVHQLHRKLTYHPRILGPRLRVVGVIDKNVPRAERVLTIKRADDSVSAGYEDTKIFTSLDEAGAALTGDDVPQYVPLIHLQPLHLPVNSTFSQPPTSSWSCTRSGRRWIDRADHPSLAIDGFQPITRGSTVPGHDSELKLIRLFPDIALFIEKPISAWEVDQVDQVKEKLEGRIVSVGYMLRYLKGGSPLTPLSSVTDRGVAVQQMKCVSILHQIEI